MPALAAPSLELERLPAVTDGRLPELLRLLDDDWVWQALASRFGPPEEMPDRLRLTHFHYRPGRRAVAGYVAERQWEQWLVDDQFAIELSVDAPERVFRYPDDPYLPGLPQAASALDAQVLLPQHVNLRPPQLLVEAIRYRPTTRAVLRHTAAWRRASAPGVALFVRVIPPERVASFLSAGRAAERSGFVLPRLAGFWPEGGVLWLATTPGHTVRKLIRDGHGPAPDQILDGLAQLWTARVPQDVGRGMDVMAGFRWTERLLDQVLPDEAALDALRRASEALRPFAEAWQPSALAHNDFYDDQIVLTPTGRIALVDFEETGPGDPMLDVGMLLAHQRWMAHFGIATEACSAYREAFRAAALRRNTWDERELAQREAFALFRLSTNPVSQLRGDWPRHVQESLELVLETLDEVA